jgi:hypothetical protein
MVRLGSQGRRACSMNEPARSRASWLAGEVVGGEAVGREAVNGTSAAPHYPTTSPASHLLMNTKCPQGKDLRSKVNATEQTALDSTPAKKRMLDDDGRSRRRPYRTRESLPSPVLEDSTRQPGKFMQGPGIACLTQLSDPARIEQVVASEQEGARASSTLSAGPTRLSGRVFPRLNSDI